LTVANERTASPPPQEEAHLRDYLRVISARRWILVTTFLAVVTATLVYVLVSTPVYRPVCQLLMEPTRTRVMNFQEVYDPTFGAETGGRMLRQEFLETQYHLILSRPILEKTYRECNLADEPEFKNAKDPISALSRRFNVSGLRNSYLVNVSFDWREGAFATKVLDYHVKQYIQSCRERSIGVTEGGLRALEEKAQDIRKQLALKSDALQSFMTNHKMVSLVETQNIVVERLKEISRNLTEAETQRLMAESKFRNIRDTLAQKRAPEEMPEVIDSPTVRDLKLEYVRTKLQASDLGDSLGPNHPVAKAAQSTLKTITETLALEVQSVLASAEAEYLRAKRQEDALGDALVKKEKAVLAFNKLAKEYLPLKEAHATLAHAYQQVSERMGEIEVALAAGPKGETVTVVSPPEVPTERTKPRRKRALALAGMLGLLLGTGLCFFVEYLDTSVKTKEDVEALLQTAVLGYVPAVSNGLLSAAEQGKGIDLIALEKPRSPMAEAFRSIRTALSFTRDATTCQQFVVTSALPSEGKTLVSVNIALTLAQAGKKVLLVDADLRRPRIHKVFDMELGRGLSNLIAGAGEISVEDALRATEIPGLQLLASGPLPPNPAELLGAQRMVELVAELAKQFDYVIYDTPPSVNVTDAAVLAQYVHGALLVVRSFSTDRHAATRARELVTAGGARLLGVVLNGVDAPNRGYSNYGAYSYNKYGYYGTPHRKKPKSLTSQEQSS